MGFKHVVAPGTRPGEPRQSPGRGWGGFESAELIACLRKPAPCCACCAKLYEGDAVQSRVIKVVDFQVLYNAATVNPTLKVCFKQGFWTI
jgi:hypothetical protein